MYHCILWLLFRNEIQIVIQRPFESCTSAEKFRYRINKVRFLSWRHGVVRTGMVSKYSSASNDCNCERSEQSSAKGGTRQQTKPNFPEQNPRAELAFVSWSYILLPSASIYIKLHI